MTSDINQLIQHHPRDFGSQRYVYPVISRRSRGVSIGINLSPTGLCNFRCIYCQVDGEQRLSNPNAGKADGGKSQVGKRSLDDCLLPEYSEDTIKQCRIRTADPNQSSVIDLDVLENELRQTLALAVSGELFKTGSFQKTPPQFRRINDIAFSGNGEPTLSPQFSEAVQIVLRVRNELGAVDVKPVLITNATLLQKPNVSESLDRINANGGEVWAKLDAGTAEYYKLVSRSCVPFETIIANITDAAKRHSIVIQTLFLKIHDELTSETEIRAYIDRLNEVMHQGGQIKLVQLYTVVRGTAEPWVAPLANRQLDEFANRVRNETNLEIETYYGG